MKNKVFVRFLGTGAAPPHLKRKQSCTAITQRDSTIFIDMGEGSQREILRYKISTNKKLILLFTHLHADHILGLIGFLSTRKMQNLENPLTIVGPPGISYYIYLQMLAHNLIPKHQIQIIETTEDIVLISNSYMIESFLVNHGIRSLGYRITFFSSIGRFDYKKATSLGIPKGKFWQKLAKGSPITYENQHFMASEFLKPSKTQNLVVVHSGDTAISESVIKYSTDADLLVHDSTYPPSESKRAQKYKHSTSLEAAFIAKQARAKRLILTHLSQLHRDISYTLSETQKIFENVDVAYDGLEIVLSYIE